MSENLEIILLACAIVCVLAWTAVAYFEGRAKWHEGNYWKAGDDDDGDDDDGDGVEKDDLVPSNDPDWWKRGQR